MDASLTFRPPLRRGVIFHAGLVLIFGGAGGYSLLLGQSEGGNAYFVLLLIIAILLFIPIPILVYRGYALLQAAYILEREGLRIRWGLRVEDIPLPDVEWVRPAAELGFDLPLPFLRTPGAILGTRNVEGLGVVEFLAADADRILLVATPQRVFAISPSDPGSFQKAFQRSMELGSLTPLLAYSSRPAAFLASVWEDHTARGLMLAGLLFTLGLYVLVGVLIPGRENVALGFYSDGSVIAFGQPSRLLLLPVLASFTFVADFIGGLFFYRRQGTRAIAYILWASTLLTPLLMAIAIIFLIRAG